jgi:hypothetical protein
MFFFRTALICGVGIALLPSDPAKQQALLETAGDKFSWAMTYCQRQPEQCTQAKVAWDGFVTKAQFGARLATDLVDRYAATPAAADEPEPEKLAPAPAKQQQKRPKPAVVEPIRVRIYKAPAAPANAADWDSFKQN